MCMSRLSNTFLRERFHKSSFGLHGLGLCVPLRGPELFLREGAERLRRSTTHFDAIQSLLKGRYDARFPFRGL